MRIIVAALPFLAIVAVTFGTGSESSRLVPGSGSRLHAHNCYPQAGRWADRLDRALSAPSRPIAIEQDLVWRVGPTGGESVVAHEEASAAAAPTLEDHFFGRVAAVLDRALAEERRDDWPAIILHLDFKTNEPAHHQAVATLLEKYDRWLTTAPRVANEAQVLPMSPGPLLVLTESGPGQEHQFHTQVTVGSRIRIFGTVPPLALSPSLTREEQAAALAGASSEALIPHGATNYRRWTNYSWAVIEQGGPSRAGDWTPADRARLQEIVARAHHLGLWIRFYTLNGHPSDQNLGWSASYNFGSVAAARERWRAAIAAGVDFVATDQYEEFVAILTPPGSGGR